MKHLCSVHAKIQSHGQRWKLISIMHRDTSQISGYADKITVQHGEVDFKVYTKKSKILVRKKKVIEEGMAE